MAERPVEAFSSPGISDVDRETNLEWNRRRWGQDAGWRAQDGYGYRWDQGYQQTVGQVSDLVDRFFRPHVGDRYDLRILELSPGGGRFTAELIRYASEMTLVDMNQACLDVCAERFQYYPTSIRMYCNDGTSLGMVDGEFDVIACYDSMVHMHPDVAKGYVAQMGRLLAADGFIWLDHSGKGLRDRGHRTDITAESMAGFARDAGLDVASQEFRNEWDCISVLRRAQR
jgi:SAM-dependent methyltransferase